MTRLVLLLCLLCAPAFCAALTISDVRTAENDGFTRVAIECSGDANYRVDNQSADKRLITITVLGVDSCVRGVTMTQQERLIDAARVDFLPKSRLARIQLRTKGAVDTADFTLKSPDRIVVDLHDNPVYTTSTASGTSSGTWRRRIIIDPGHGGKDPGAIGKANGHRIEEADIALATGLKVRAYLAADPRFSVSMTRSDDRYVSLTDRTSIAHREAGDLFVSLHLNAVGASAANRAQGFELWTWNRTSNSSTAAKALAKIENSEPGVSSGNSDILTTMMTDALESQSLISRVLADAIHSEMVKDSYFRGRDRGIEHARFRVLANYDMPSILIEMGFITHPDEGARMNTTAHQQRIAQLVYQGIVTYYERTDPKFPRQPLSAQVAAKVN